MNSGKYKLCSRVYATVLMVLFLVSCSSNSENPEDKEAQKMTVSDIRSNTGYAWFDSEFNTYKPDTAVINEIKKLYPASGLDFLVFVNPSCACTGTQKTFPSFIKILDESGISEAKYQIYSMLVYNAPNPYKSVINLWRLPSFYIMKNGSQKYSILDSLDYYSTIEPKLNHTLEEFVLKGIKQ